MIQRNEKIWGTAGCGKTTELLRRINIAIDSGIEKNEVCVVTYRKSMALDLKNKLSWDKKDSFLVGTLHSICLKLIIDYGVTIFNEKHLKLFCEKYGFQYNNVKFDFDNISSKNYSKIQLINNCADSLNEYLLQPEEIGKLINPMQWTHFGFPPESYLIKFIKMWNEFRKENKIYLFSDIVRVVYEQGLVPDAKMLVVDEFQDLTPLQNKVIKMWSKEMDYNVIAGDPLQCIYNYKGANPKFFREFEAEETILPVSYRLPSNILKFAKKVIYRGGEPFPDVHSNVDGGIIEVVDSFSVADKIRAFDSNCFHLVRCNYLMVWITNFFMVEGIPFKSNDKFIGWNKKTVDMFNMVLNFREFFLTNKNNIKPVDILTLINLFPQQVFSLKKSQIKLDVLKGVALSDIYILNMFSTFFDSKGGFKTVVLSNEPFSVSLKKVLPEQKRMVYGYLKKSNKHLVFSDISVIVSTIHGVKGLESETVFLYNDVPKRVALTFFSPKLLVDELRVWFVGVTRARKNLFLVKGVLGSKNFFNL